MPVRAPFFQFQSHKLVYGDYSVTGRICQWVAKNKSYKTTSLVFDNSRHITYNGKNIIKKRDEGMSTPICGRTESLYLLREDWFAPGEYGSGAAWLSGRQGHDGSARYSRGYPPMPAKRFRVFPGMKRSGTTGISLVF